MVVRLNRDTGLTRSGLQSQIELMIMSIDQCLEAFKLEFEAGRRVPDDDACIYSLLPCFCLSDRQTKQKTTMLTYVTKQVPALGRRHVYTLSSVVDHLPQAVAKFHDIVAEEVRTLSSM